MAGRKDSDDALNLKYETVAGQLAMLIKKHGVLPDEMEPLLRGSKRYHEQLPAIIGQVQFKERGQVIELALRKAGANSTEMAR